MDKDTTCVAIDDSKRTRVVGILRPGDREPELREIPNEPKGVRQLVERLTREGAVRACYEAGVSGYDLYRQLTALGVPCQVAAPALTPRRPGQRIRTDRRDAAKLVRLFRAGELTGIHVPDEAEEGVRDLLRCREAVRRDVLRWRHRVVKFLDRHGRRYLAGKNWTQRHWTSPRRDSSRLLASISCTGVIAPQSITTPDVDTRGAAWQRSWRLNLPRPLGHVACRADHRAHDRIS